MKLFPGRYTVEAPDEFVVFLIGLRVNSIFSFHKWFPVAMAMPRMLKVLYQNPDKGFLEGEQFFRFFPLTTILVSYWKSFDHLEKFAKNPNDPHLSAWGKFMKKIGGDGSVGIWHETYKVTKGNYEAVYGNMPRFGLAKAFQHIEVSKHGDSARQRLK